MVGSKGAGGSGGSKAPLSREKQFELHNPNSELRINLTREDKRQKKIEDLRRLGFSERELRESYDVPLAKVQDPPVGPLNDEAVQLISWWGCDRIDYLHLAFCGKGKGSKQALGEMKGIADQIKDVIWPRLAAIYTQIRAEEGVPVMPPKHFHTPLKDYKLPASPSKGSKGKARK